MSLENENIRIPTWIAIILALVLIAAIFTLWYCRLDDHNVKMIGIVGGMISGIVVFILTFATTVRLIQKL